MRGYKSFDGTPHPGDLRHRVQIGYTENTITENGYPEPRDVILCKVWASAIDAGNQHYRSADAIPISAPRMTPGRMKPTESSGTDCSTKS